MKARAVERSLLAWTVGALVGAATLLAEAFLGPVAFAWGPLAAYSLAGGSVAVVSRSLLAALVPADSARAGALGAIAGFASLHALYYVNVEFLPGEHYLSGTSLAWDALVGIPIVAGAILLGRTRWTQVVRERWAHAGAAIGASSLAGGLVLVFAAAERPGSEVERNGTGPDLVVVVLDSMRADRLPVGSSHPAAPMFSRLAAQGRVFPSAWAASSWTVPSVTRILCAESPDETPTLAERLARHGYRTASFTDNPHLARGARVMRGFDRVERSVGAWRSVVLGTALGEALERLAPGSDEQLATKAIAWMERQPGPFFLYVHLMDSHTPYRFPPLDGRPRRGRRIEFPRVGMQVDAEEAESIRARYDGGVRSADGQMGRLIAAVEARGRPFLAVVTSDHGESLGEDGRWFHGGSLAPELLAIPLVLVGNGLERGVIASPVGHAALGPTLLAAASVPCEECRAADLGRDVPTRLVEGALPPRFAYSTDGRYKLLVDLETGRRSLYDRLSDPAERHDVAATEPGRMEALAAALTPPDRLSEPSPAQQERLRALGYLGE
jgi:arylsulfatase A-like enzyme